MTAWKAKGSRKMVCKNEQRRAPLSAAERMRKMRDREKRGVTLVDGAEIGPNVFDAFELAGLYCGDDKAQLSISLSTFAEDQAKKLLQRHTAKTALRVASQNHQSSGRLMAPKRTNKSG